MRHIETLRAQTRPAGTNPEPGTSDNTIVITLTTQITRLRQQHRQQVQALRAALEQAHGENLQLRRELARRGWVGPPSAT